MPKSSSKDWMKLLDQTSKQQQQRQAKARAKRGPDGSKRSLSLAEAFANCTHCGLQEHITAFDHEQEADYVASLAHGPADGEPYDMDDELAVVGGDEGEGGDAAAIGGEVCWCLTILVG